MAMMIREDCTSGELDVQWNYKEPKLSITENMNSQNCLVDPESIMAKIEAIHEHPFSTRNFTRYHKEALLSSVPTWTKPYCRPVILHHNEKNGKTIGRVLAAEYVTTGTLSKTPSLVLTVNIPDKDAKEQINNGILKTTSIGAIVHDCRCSICGQNIAEEGPCEHEKGNVYDGQVCYWDIYIMEAKEISYVIVPSDIFSQNIEIYKADSFDKNIKESNKRGALSVAEQVNNSVQVPENNQPSTGGATPIDYKTKYEELKVKYDELEKSQNNIDTKKITDELNDTKVLLSQAQKSLDSAKNELVIKKADAIKEMQLRESLEKDLEVKEKELKESLLDNVLVLRKTLNKAMTCKESLEKRSSESLRDTINDLKEEANISGVSITESNSSVGGVQVAEGASQLNKAEKPENPGLVKENIEENNKVTVKENNSDSNMNLEESLESILNGFLN